MNDELGNSPAFIKVDVQTCCETGLGWRELRSGKVGKTIQCLVVTTKDYRFGLEGKE